MIRGGAAGSYAANLGPQPRGLARGYCSSQQPTSIVCVFVYREICRSNPMCGGKESGRFDSMCEGLCLKGSQASSRKHYIIGVLLKNVSRGSGCKSPTLGRVCVPNCTRCETNTRQAV